MERRLIPVKLDNFKPLREIVFESLREAIIGGVLRPGERLMEIQLAEEMGVSRTPVREAIRKLELEGFVVMVPRKGAYVAGISVKDITDVFEIRASLEALACSLAAERITDSEMEELERLLVKSASALDMDDALVVDTDFHDVIYKASRNERLCQILQNLREQIQRFRSESLAVPGRMRQVLEEHRKIVEAIYERDAAKAERVALEHMDNATNSMLDAMRENKSILEIK